MSSRPDALRSTLDSLSLDPKVKEDRPYLVSVLRRLGYTEAEIEAHLGPGPEATPVAPTEPGEEPVLEAEGPRVVEVEYLGGEDVEEFEPVYRARSETTTFAIEESPEAEEPGLLEFQATEAPEPEALLEFRELEPEPLPESLSGPPAEQDWPEEDWPEDEAWPEEEPERTEQPGQTETTFEVTAPPENGSTRRVRVKVIKAASREEALEKARAMGLDAREAVPVAVEQRENVWPEPAPGSEESPEIPDWPEGPAGPESEPEPAPEWHEDTQEIPDWPEEVEGSEEPAWGSEAGVEPLKEDAPGGEAPQWMDEAEGPETALAGEPFRYKDYVLHTREVQLSNDRMQRIYFFAKGTPKSGEPCSMPDGYKVKENERTGLPYLTRDRS